MLELVELALACLCLFLSLSLSLSLTLCLYFSVRSLYPFSSLLLRCLLIRLLLLLLLIVVVVVALVLFLLSSLTLTPSLTWPRGCPHPASRRRRLVSLLISPSPHHLHLRQLDLQIKMR